MVTNQILLTMAYSSIRTLLLPDELLLLFFNYFYRALLEGESNPEILILTERIENIPQGK